MPARFGDLRSPGQLEALRFVDWPEGVATRTRFLPYLSQPLTVDWVPIEDFDPDTDTVRVEAQSQGAASFSRGEGCTYAHGMVYFSCTNGGDQGQGQIFAYDINAGTLTLFFESTDAAVLQSPDNLAVAPDGQLYLCEDGAGADHVVGVNRKGEPFIAVSNNFNESEFAGVCFADDVMFLNTQSPGITYAIRGPWRQYPVRRKVKRLWGRVHRELRSTSPRSLDGPGDGRQGHWLSRLLRR